jgi:hypothetical protein
VLGHQGAGGLLKSELPSGQRFVPGITEVSLASGMRFEIAVLGMSRITDFRGVRMLPKLCPSGGSSARTTQQARKGCETFSHWINT